jgi:EmrB/QacA subfamily drug resistance transporter
LSIVGQRTAPAWLILSVACAAQFMVVLDVSIVNVALPQIRGELGFSPAGLQWVINAYTLAFAGFLLLGGRAADLVGRRKVFLLGLGLFTAASLVGGFAQSPATLIAARAAQGLGGAVLSPASLTILTTTFTEGRARARALGTWSAVAGAGGAAGALFGGILTHYLSWRWILFVNVPIGVLVSVAALAVLSESRRADASRSLDVAGALLVTTGLVVLVYGIVSTDTHPWTSAHTLITLGLAVLLLVAFLLVEAKVARAPLMPLRLFASRSVSGANLVMLLLCAALFAMWYFLSLYLQTVLRFDSLTAGLAFLPQSLAIIVGAQFTARLLPRTGPRPLLVAGALVTSAGFFWLSQLTTQSSYAADVLVPGMLITLGLGLTFTPIAAAATGGVAQSEAGLVSGLVNTSRQCARCGQAAGDRCSSHRGRHDGQTGRSCPLRPRRRIPHHDTGHRPPPPHHLRAAASPQCRAHHGRSRTAPPRDAASTALTALWQLCWSPTANASRSH